MQNNSYKISLYTSPAHIPLSLFTHPWFVISKDGVTSRYEVRYKKNKKNPELGYMHIDDLLPYSGIPVFSFLAKPLWNATLLGSIEGGNNSSAHKMYEFIVNSPNTYNNKLNYFLFGPNSNTYAQWILDNNPAFPAKLKWNALGKDYRKCIDRKGFFYNVYDIDNKRVLKIEKPRIVQYFKHFFWAGRLPREVRNSANMSYEMIGSTIDQTLLAHPQIESTKSYSQDKVFILEKYISSHTLEDNKKIIDLYADHILGTWQNGFSDKIFNFTRNCGIDTNGKIVLVDFNEISFDKEEVKKLIQKKRWINRWSHTHLLSITHKELWEYYKKVMSMKITHENLETFWIYKNHS